MPTIHLPLSMSIPGSVTVLPTDTFTPNDIVQTPLGRGIVRRFLAERGNGSQYDTYAWSEEVISVTVAFPSAPGLEDWGMGGSNGFEPGELNKLK